MKELFSIGPIHIYFFGLMIAIGIISSAIFALNEAKNTKISEDDMLNLIITVVISGVIGARIFYILFYNPYYYLSHPAEIIRIDEGGLSIHGGIFSSILAGYIFCVKTKNSFFKLGDIAVTAVALAQGIGRIGCDVFGKPMTKVMPWAVEFNGQLVHPVQVYEFILDFILFTVLWRRSRTKKFEGELFVTYIIAFPIIRGIVEFYRTNPLVFGQFSVSYLLSALLIVMGIILFRYLSKNNTIYTEYNDKKNLSLIKQIIIVIILVIMSIAIFYTVQG